MEDICQDLLKRVEELNNETLRFLNKSRKWAVISCICFFLIGILFINWPTNMSNEGYEVVLNFKTGSHAYFNGEEMNDNAIEHFQMNNGLVVDGIYITRTMRKMTELNRLDKRNN